MNVFTTEQFNKEVKDFSHNDQQVIFRAFQKASEMTKEQLFSTGKISYSLDGDEEIFIIKEGKIRIYCIIEKSFEQDFEESLVFIALERQTDKRSHFSLRLHKSIDNLRN
ncbi:MAG: hypothetical protein RI964_1465 [Pseudomonadota bacterium]|jgi:mRNA-degrading endonuclease RelE of RelBE toxin-antitoxin system